MTSAANDLTVACPNNVASQPPFSIPDNVELDLSLVYDDGKQRPLRYPPYNDGTLVVSILQGADSCEVDYDGTSAPIVRARNDAACSHQVCRMKLNYTEPCRAASIISSVNIWVVNAICLQPDVRCPDATKSALGAPDGSLTCTPKSATVRQLSCAAAGFQQRTLWTSALLSPQPGKPKGAFPCVHAAARLTAQVTLVLPTMYVACG